MTLSVRVDTTAWKALEARLTPAAVDRVVRAVAFDIQADTVRRIQTGPKTGRIYRRGKTRSHQASAPGEAPATDLGALASSYRARPVRPGIWRVGSGMVYAAPLEFGDRRGRLKARPHLRPAFAAAKKVMRRRMKAMLGGRS